MPTDAPRDAPGRWFLRIHPLVWVAAGILAVYLMSRALAPARFGWLDPLGLVGFWALTTALVVLLVLVLIRTKRRPETERRL